MEGAIRREAGWRWDISPLLDRAFDWFTCLYIFTSIFLPSGSIYGFNVKYPLYLGLLPLAIYSVFRREQAEAGQLALLVGVPALFAGWIILGLCDGFAFASVLRQYADLLLTFLVCWLVALFCGDDELRRLRFLRLVVNAEIATALLKVGLVAYALIRGIPVVEMVALLSKVFGTDLMTMDLGSLFGRVQFISDALIPICIFIVLRHRDRMHMGSLRAVLTILLLLVSVLLSFSRYFWAFTALAFFVGLLLGKRDRFQAILFITLALSIIVSLPALVGLYQLRFSADVAGGSDLQRTEQIHALSAFFLDAPLLGHGLGSYTTQVIREQDTEVGRYGYEVQLLALSGQLGVVGMTLILGLTAYYYRNLWWNSPLNIPDRIGIGLLLCFWIAAGLSNPLLFNPIAGVNYATLATLAEMAGRKTNSPITAKRAGAEVA